MMGSEKKLFKRYQDLHLLDPARAELTADEILGERELITELTMLLWSADPLDLVKLDTGRLAGKVTGRGATATGRGATRTVLV